MDELSSLSVGGKPKNASLTLWTSFDPVDQVTTLWTNKTGLWGGLGGKRS